MHIGMTKAAVRVSTHSRLKAAGFGNVRHVAGGQVSTHSRLKAAGFGSANRYLSSESFNTQPPEGGWVLICLSVSQFAVSTHSRLKAAGTHQRFCNHFLNVSTHSRLKAAGKIFSNINGLLIVSTHSRLKAAGPTAISQYHQTPVSTHSRLKAAGAKQEAEKVLVERFNTQPPEGGWIVNTRVDIRRCLFQHTAA